jgi:hypothetical protein
MKLTFFAKRFELNISKCIHLFISMLLVINTISVTKTKVLAVEPTYQITYSLDKTTVKNAENFRLNINVVNTGSEDITNFEIRVPFYNFIGDTQVVTVNPSFNKLLNSNDFPVGFNSRSWIVNTFGAGETKNFSIEYKVIDDPKIANGLAAVFTYPGTWTDPKGLETNKPLKLGYFRSDIYVNSVYKSSAEYGLPKLGILDNELSTVKLPDRYNFPGSRTTQLKNINSADIKSVSNFVLETQDTLIEWQMPIDFSGSDVAIKMQKLDEYLKVDWGIVDTPEKDLAFLNKPVKVTFKNTNFVNEPKLKLKGLETDLKAAKATWTKGSDKVSISMTSFDDISLYPALSLDKTTIETNEDFVVIKGKTSDPSSNISYKIDNAATKEVLGIDLQTGDFEVRLDGLKDVKQVEFSSKLRNGEVNEKIVLIKSNASSVTPTVPVTIAPRTSSQLLNPITLALLLSALAILSITCGFIYYLYHRKKMMKSRESIGIEGINTRKTNKPALEEIYSLKDISSGKKELNFNEGKDLLNPEEDLIKNEEEAGNEVKKDLDKDEKDASNEPPKFLKSE